MGILNFERITSFMEWRTALTIITKQFVVLCHWGRTSLSYETWSRVNSSLGKVVRLLSKLFSVVSNRRSSTARWNQSYSWDCASYLYCILSFWAATRIYKHCVSDLDIDDWEEYFQAQHMTYIEEDIPQKIGGILPGVIPVYTSYKTSQTWWLFIVRNGQSSLLKLHTKGVSLQ